MRSNVLSSRIVFFKKACSLGVLAVVAAGCSSGFQRFDNNFYQSAVPQAPNGQQQLASNPYPGSSNSLDTITTASVNRSGARRLAPLSVVAPPTYGAPVNHAPEPTYVTPQATYQPPQAYRPPYKASTQAALQPLSSYAHKPAPVDWQQYPVKASPLPAVQKAPVSVPSYNPPKPSAQPVANYVNSLKTDRITTSSVSRGTTLVQKQSARIQPQITANQNIPAAVATASTTPAGWTSAGGTTIVAQQGETLFNLSKRYGVPVSAIQSANNINASSGLQAGQKILIPNYVFSRSAPVSAPDSNPKTKAARSSTGYRGEARSDLAVVPTKRPAYVASISKPKVQAIVDPIKIDPVNTASLKPTKPANVAAVDSSTKAPARSGISQFRWPVQGRVVSSFGQNGAAGSNEGIDISVPEGTAIKAAENGLVIYAGNEISTYGNLILIRHADDWVSAYAHTKDFNVKKGDRVTRGQTIGRSGQSGAADRPKLHFELRKDSTPVDPRKYLAG